MGALLPEVASGKRPAAATEVTYDSSAAATDCWAADSAAVRKSAARMEAMFLKWPVARDKAIFSPESR